MSFVLEKGSRIVIYGASGGSIKWCTEAQNQGFQIEAFLDKNAEKLKQVNHIPVYTINDWRPNRQETIIVIIMLQNAMQHYRIMMQLYSKGIQKVLCFPVESYGLQKDMLSSLRLKYNECIRFQFGKMLEGIPEYTDMLQTEEQERKKIICENERDITLYVPFELCYTEEKKTKSFWQSDYTMKAMDLACHYIKGKNICQLRPYWELFDYLDGKRDDCRLYLDIFGKSGHVSHENYSDNQLLKDRNSLYELYCREFEQRSKFFEESAAAGRVTQEGKIRIIDGVHRSIFLIRAGYRWIPVRLPKAELKYLGSTKSLQLLSKNIAEPNVLRLEYPIEHPDFFGFVFDRDDIRKLWVKISNEILTRKISYQMIIDLSLTGGYFARNFFRMGSKKVYCYSEQNDYTELAGQLFGMSLVEYIHSLYDLKPLIKDKRLVVVSDKIWNMEPEIFESMLRETNVYMCVIDVNLQDDYWLKSRYCMEKEWVLVDKYAVGGYLRGAILCY